MRLAADFRSIAREALRGKWMLAVLVGLVALLLGGGADSGPKVNFNINTSGGEASFSISGQTLVSTGNSANSEAGALLIGASFYVILIALVVVAIYLLLGSCVEIGYAKFNLNLVDGEKGAFENLFSYFSYWNTMIAARLLQMLFIFAWSLLLIIPGIVASYSYAMTSYILAENPQLTASEAIAKSKQMMMGNRWRLFCLHFSFIGWSILCALTLGIGNLWLTPYKQAAIAAFYRDVSETEYTI